MRSLKNTESFDPFEYSSSPMNTLQEVVLRQLSGQAMTTVLCCIPPRPAPWMLDKKQPTMTAQSRRLSCESRRPSHESRRLSCESYSHERESVHNCVSCQHFTESLDLVIFCKVLQTLPGCYHLRHILCKLSLQYRVDHHQTLACVVGRREEDSEGRSEKNGYSLRDCNLRDL